MLHIESLIKVQYMTHAVIHIKFMVVDKNTSYKGS